MPKYLYVAVNEKNRKYKNEMIADSAEEVRKNLRARNLNPLSVTEAGKEEEKSIWDMEIGGNKDVHDLKLKKNKMLVFFHQMALMMRSGISLSIAMEVMIDSEKDKKMRQILRDISINLYNGLTLSRAMGAFKTFPLLYINIIQAGEANGRPRAKLAKDTAAGAVLLVSIAAAVAGGIIFLPKMLPMLR